MALNDENLRPKEALADASGGSLQANFEAFRRKKMVRPPRWSRPSRGAEALEGGIMRHHHLGRFCRRPLSPHWPSEAGERKTDWEPAPSCPQDELKASKETRAKAAALRGGPAFTAELREKFIARAKSYLGVPYAQRYHEPSGCTCEGCAAGGATRGSRGEPGLTAPQKFRSLDRGLTKESPRPVCQTAF